MAEGGYSRPVPEVMVIILSETNQPTAGSRSRDVRGLYRPDSCFSGRLYARPAPAMTDPQCCSSTSASRFRTALVYDRRFHGR